MNDLNLKGKSILFISPVFYDYHTVIKENLEYLGAKVFFYAERDCSLRFSIINNLYNSKLEEFQSKHYLNILENTCNIEFDYLFVIKGYKIPISFLEIFRERYSKAKMIMYQWDSESNNPYVHLLPFFDKVFSFDPKDVSDHDNIEYLPNFYLDDINGSVVRTEMKNEKYDLFFVASYLPERYQFVVDLKKFSKENDLRIKSVLIMPFLSYIKQFLKGNYLNLKIISFHPLNRIEYLRLWAQSKAVLDIGSFSQTGLTQRVIETIQVRKKLITTNEYVKDEAFYKSNQVFILGLNLSDSIVEFLNEDFVANETGCSIDNWIKTIFS